MKKEVWYKQCCLIYVAEEKKSETVAWIPEHLAVVGKSIYFGKKTDKQPDKLWLVESVGNSRISGEYLLAHERDYKVQREASDI